jgi:hypothetical protein
MKRGASLAAAFETIQGEVGFDMLSSVPHPENLRYQLDAERKTMHRLGMALPQIVGSADSEDLHYAAHVIRRYFGDALRMEPMPEFMADVPRFLLSPGSRTANRTDPQQLAEHLGRVPIAQEDVICIVSTKLTLLQKLLHLSDAEIKFLKLAYGVSRQHARTNSLSCNITLALEHIAVQDDAHRDRAIAVLLDIPAADVTQMLASPCRLKALRFVDSVYTIGEPTLRAVFFLTDEFIDVLESTFRSHNALLQAILEPEHDLDLHNDADVPIGHLYEVWPKDLAEAFESAVLNRPLKSHHIDALVRWYTGGYRAHPAQYAPLAGRISVEGVREAIKRAAFDCCIANAPLGGFALMRALYAKAI